MHSRAANQDTPIRGHGGEGCEVWQEGKLPGTGTLLRVDAGPCVCPQRLQSSRGRQCRYVSTNLGHIHPPRRSEPKASPMQPRHGGYPLYRLPAPVHFRTSCTRPHAVCRLSLVGRGALPWGTRSSSTKKGPVDKTATGVYRNLTPLPPFTGLASRSPRHLLHHQEPLCVWHRAPR